MIRFNRNKQVAPALPLEFAHRDEGDNDNFGRWTQEQLCVVTYHRRVGGGERPLFSGTLSAQSNLMGRRREGFFGRAREKVSRQDRSGIDGAQIHKALEDGTKRRYKGAIRLWLEYVLCPYSLHRFPPPLPYLRLAPLMLSQLTRPHKRLKLFELLSCERRPPEPHRIVWL
jgi:hypothetical protein